MVNKIPAFLSSSRLIRWLLFAAPLVTLFIYLTRRPRPTPSLEPLPSAVEPTASSALLDALPTPYSAPHRLGQKDELTLLLVTFVYGALLTLVYNVYPDFVGLFMVVTFAATLIIALWRRFITRRLLAHILIETVTLPIRFYWTSRSQARSAEREAAALARAPWWMVVVEIGIIIAFTFAISRPFYESPPNWQLSGGESEWLTSTIHAAYDGLQQYGRIPRWQPYIAHGEPIIENPFNFIFNPFAGMPALFLGPVTGLRISVVLNYFMAGLGGWFLGRVLGFSALARVLLALLLIGKGSMHSMLNASYYQLAFSQLYMAWVTGGVIAIARFPRQRWPLVLTALALALQLFNGNLWYVLPTAVGAVCIALVCIVTTGKGWINREAMRRYVTSGLLALGLSAVFALPVLLQSDRVGRHDEELQAGWAAPLTDIIPLYFDSNPDRIITVYEPLFGYTNWHYVNELNAFYYHFVVPSWYVLLIFILLPFYPAVRPRIWLIGLAALVLFAFATVWGAGGKQPVLWLYDTFAPLRQWRFVPRALAVGSFWLALWVGLRTDILWKAVQNADWGGLFNIDASKRKVRLIPIALSLIMVVAAGLAAIEVNDRWYQASGAMRAIEPTRDECTRWLRQQYPDEYLEVWQQHYSEITTFLNHRIRTSNIAADFEMSPQAPTVGADWLDLNGVLPSFAQLNEREERTWGKEMGYQMVQGSPLFADGLPCLSRQLKPTLPYAYSITLTDLNQLVLPAAPFELDVRAFNPIHLVERRDDQIALIVTDKRTAPIVVGVQESAYPGWRVEVDGQPVHLESVGGQIGVVLPAGDAPVQIYFVYEPTQPVIGGLITLITSVICVLYLMSQRRESA